MISETIFALSTGTNKAAIAIVRVSGEKVCLIIRGLVGSIPPPREAKLCYLAYNDDLIDQAIVIYFNANNSYTGEDMVEFHIHGSNAVIKNLSDILTNKFNISIAKPGQFTRRALENNRIDLSQAESILDLIESETKEQQKQALKLLSGAASNKTKQWRDKILRALALAEVMIDFSDEDVPKNTRADINDQVLVLLDLFKKELINYKSSELVRDGYDVTIIGKPNVGKSSLLNYLAGKQKAIVSEYAGTTRDIIELSLDLNGHRVNFFDTAGIHQSEDLVELIGIERTVEKARNSNMRIFLLENNDLVEDFDLKVEPNDLLLKAKADIVEHASYRGVSGKTGKGVQEMLDLISINVKNATFGDSILINERHHNIIKNAYSSLLIVQQELNKADIQIEIVAEHLRITISQLDLLVGKINVEDVLGSVFSAFCIGK